MTQTGMTWRFMVTAVGASSTTQESALEAHLDQLMEELLKLEACNPEFHDPSVGGSLATGEIEIEFLFGADEDEAVAKARPILRAAIHAAGGYTPKWDDDEGTRPSQIVKYEPETTELTFA